MVTAQEVYYQEGFAKVRAQDEFRRELTGRAFGLLSTSIALIAAGVLVLTLVDPDQLGIWVVVSASVVVVLWCSVITLCLLAIKPIRDWNDGTALDSLGEAVGQPQGYSDSDLLGYLADNYRTAWVQNKRHLDGKVTTIKRAGFALLLQAGGIVIYASIVVTAL